MSKTRYFDTNNKSRPLAWLLIVFLVARLLFYFFMPDTYSIDMHSWVKVAALMQDGKNPYVETHVLNWPPFWPGMLYLLSLIAKFFSIPIFDCIQLFLGITEGLLLLFLYKFCLFLQPGKNPFKLLLFGIALNPANVLLTMQHGNFDVVVVLWVLLFASQFIQFYHSKNAQHWLLACFFLGMGIFTKTVPVILAPLLLIDFKSLSFVQKIKGLFLLSAPVVIGMGIIMGIHFDSVVANVISYRSLSGWFGFSGILALLQWHNLGVIYVKASTPILLFVLPFILCYRISTNQDQMNQKVIAVIFLLLLSIPLFGPGYAPQYLYWFLPPGLLYFHIAVFKNKWIWYATYCILLATYISEYALFESHGAFLTHFTNNKNIHHISYIWSGQPYQVMLRIPIFAAYLTLFWITLRSAFFSPRHAIPDKVI